MTEQNAQAKTGMYKTTLKAFSRALVREAHVLTREPDMLWQQMYNRLQWEGEDVKHVLAQEFTVRNSPGAKPWIRLKNPFRESEALVRIIDGLSEEEACAFSPDGHLIVSASGQYIGTLELWDAFTGQLLRTLGGRNSAVEACVFSPDGRFILSADGDHTLRMWEATSGQLLRTLEGHTGSVHACAFSPDGRFILSASEDKTLRVWETATGRSLRILKGHKGPVRSCGFSPDGRFIVSASSSVTGKDNGLHVWKVSNGRPLHILKHKSWVMAWAFSPDGRFIVSTSFDDTLRVWQISKGKLLQIIENPIGTENANAFSFSPDGCYIVSSSGNTLLVRDATSGQLLHTLAGHTALVNACAFSPDGRFIVSASDDKTLRVWEASSGEPERIIEGYTGYACKFSPDGRFIVSSGKGLLVREAATGQLLRTLESGAPFSFSADGRLIVSASNDNTLRVWNATNGQLLRTLEGHTDNVNACTLSPDGRVIVSGSNDKTLRLWEATNIRYIVSGSDDKAFRVWEAASSMPRRTIRMWEAVSGDPRATIESQKWEVIACLFSPNGRFILSAIGDKPLQMWDAVTGNASYTLEGKGSSCVFSPDGHSIISAGYRILDADTGKVIRTLQGHTGLVNAYAFSPDGRFIVSGSADNKLRVWNPDNGELVTCIPLPGVINSLGLHPTAAQILCSVGGGAVYWLEIIGFEYGPIIITGVHGEQGIMVRCPACQNSFQIGKDILGSEIPCPQPDCRIRLKVNSFTISI